MPRIFGILFVALIWVGCGGGKKEGPPPEELIAKSWKVKILRIGGSAPPPDVVATASFTFFKEGRYEILLGDLERGKWRLSENKKILITVPDNRPDTENHIDITELKSDRLVLDNATGPNPTHFELVPQ